MLYPFSFSDLCKNKFVLMTSVEVVALLYIFVSFVFYNSKLGLLLMGCLTLGIYYVIVKYSLPGGDEVLVKEILGTDIVDESNDCVPRQDAKDEDTDYRMRVVAHRFAGLDAPENSLVALDNCYKSGGNAVEFDVAISCDNVIVVFHDDTVERLSGIPGTVSKMTWDQLCSVNISTNHPFRDQFQNARIAKFEDVVKKCLEYDMRMFIDIKDSKQEVIEGICKMYETYPMLYRRAVVSSFNPWIIYQIRKRKPSIVGCMAWRPYYMSCENYVPDKPSSQKKRSSSVIVHKFNRICDIVYDWSFFKLFYIVLGLSCVLIHKDTVTKESIRWWRCRNVRCIAWSVNQLSEKQHFAKNLRITYLTDTMHSD